MKLLDDFIPNSEYTKRIFVRKGNKIYCKNIEDKYGKLFRKFKNATKAKKFFHNFIIENPLNKMGEFYLSSR